MRKTVKLNNAESVRQFQPRVALWQPWEKVHLFEDATLKELRRRWLTTKPRKPFQGSEQFPGAFLNPGFQSKPWADIRQRFQRYSIFGRTLIFRAFVQSRKLKFEL